MRKKFTLGMAALATAVWVLAAQAALAGSTLPGAQQLFEAPYLDWIRDKRVGVIAHESSRMIDGTHVVDALFQRKDLELRLIFAPEHGFRGGHDSLLPDSRDPVTGLPVVSLYGPRKAPEPEHFAKIDVLLVDLQDVGVRYYTYMATMAYAMKAAKEAGKKVIVLDRPNPLGGKIVEGAVLEDVLQGNFAALYPIATRHGMTLGELARLFNEAFGIDADLSVVPLKGWTRDLLWDQTGLPWLTPSPALPSFEQAFLYGVFGTLESLPLAVGRGETNQRAFRVYGAPWISPTDATELVDALNALVLPGLRFDPVEWVPTRREYEGQLCRGFEIQVTNRAKVKGFRSLIEVLKTMRRTLGTQLDFSRTAPFLGTRWLRDALLRGMSTQDILQKVETEGQEFKRLRERVLLY